MSEAPAAGNVLRSILLFTAAQATLITVIAVVLTRFVWSDADGGRAVTISAWVAAGVQVITFAVAKLVARQQVMAGWGLGVVLRFAVVAAWAFLGIKALGLAPVPALLSLVIFFFVSTVIEPIFLNA
jgi:hypothetical protein